jgi:hypothetical protein
MRSFEFELVQLRDQLLSLLLLALVHRRRPTVVLLILTDRLLQLLLEHVSEVRCGGGVAVDGQRRQAARAAPVLNVCEQRRDGRRVECLEARLYGVEQHVGGGHLVVARVQPRLAERR